MQPYPWGGLTSKNGLDVLSGRREVFERLVSIFRDLRMVGGRVRIYDYFLFFFLLFDEPTDVRGCDLAAKAV